MFYEPCNQYACQGELRLARCNLHLLKQSTITDIAFFTSGCWGIDLTSYVPRAHAMKYSLHQEKSCAKISRYASDRGR